MALTTGQKVAIAVGTITAVGAITAATITAVSSASGGTSYKCDNAATCGNNNKVSTSDDNSESR